MGTYLESYTKIDYQYELWLDSFKSVFIGKLGEKWFWSIRYDGDPWDWSGAIFDSAEDAAEAFAKSRFTSS